VLIRVHYLSLDPYMRSRMVEARSYAQPQKLDETMIGGTVGVIEASRNPNFAVGDTVLGTLGWAEYGLSDGRGLMKVDTRVVPMSAYLGTVGMPGVTAWYGLNRICAPKPGETVLVSAASGAVVRISAATSPGNSASTPASITASTPTSLRWRARSGPRLRTASTACSRTLVACAWTVRSHA
jgi:NADPH-dependent curcumin reductase CurA